LDNHGQTGSNRPWTKEPRIPKTGRLEFADQMAKSRWLRIQSVNHVFALTLTLNMLEEYGLEPMIASNVEETRQILERRPMHVVFCEDKLPDGGFREPMLGQG
jgi:hypothetical protein